MVKAYIGVAEIAEEHVGETVEILVPRPGSDGADGSPAERYVAELVAGGDPERPFEVADLAPIISGGELQGAVVMLGGEGDAETSAYLGVAAVAALTGVAMLNAREDASRGDDRLLAELLTARELAPGEIVRRARQRGCDLTGGFLALCLNPGGTPDGRVMATIVAERPDALVEPRGARIDLEVNYPLLPNQAAMIAKSLEGLERPEALEIALRQGTSAGTQTARSIAADFLSQNGWSARAEQLVFTANGRQCIAASLGAIVPPGGRCGVEALSL